MEHNFIPSHYFTTLGPHEPVLTVEPGDSIVTTTVDARGVMRTVSRPLPGEILKPVHFLSRGPSRETHWS